MNSKETQINVSNIFKDAKNEEVERLLRSIGPIVAWEAKYGWAAK